mgnify:CR=1 FL=1
MPGYSTVSLVVGGCALETALLADGRTILNTSCPTAEAIELKAQVTTLEEHVAAATPCCPEELDDSQDRLNKCQRLEPGRSLRPGRTLRTHTTLLE